MKSTEEMYQDIQPLVENEWHEAAINAFGKLLESYPEFAPAHSDLGALYYKIGDKEKSLNHFEKAAQLDPGDIAIKKNLANFYNVEQGRVEDALKLYADVVATDPRDVETLRNCGFAPEQRFTQPPPRYSMSSLVRELERRGPDDHETDRRG